MASASTHTQTQRSNVTPNNEIAMKGPVFFVCMCVCSDPELWRKFNKMLTNEITFHTYPTFSNVLMIIL